MGGAGGHMPHPYDLDEVKDGAGLIKMLMGIPVHLAMDAVNATIKLDGSNNSVKVIDRRGKYEFALDRGAMGLGKGELDYQGLTPDDYEARQLNPGLQSSTNILLGILNDALRTAHIEPELKALGLIDEDGKADYSKFLNTEFYDKDNPNSIAYDIGNFIAFHGVYQFYEKYHRRGTPGKPKPDAKQVRGGLPRPTYIDKKDNKEKFKKVTSERVPYNVKALESLVKKVRPFAKKEGFELLGPAATRQKNENMAKEAIADMKTSLTKPITIQFSRERSETKSLGEWLKDSVNPLTTKYKLEDGSEVYLGCDKCIRLSDGATTNPYNKKRVYEPVIINKVPIVDYYANSDGQVNALAALHSAILFHGTRLLGQDIKNHLTTEVFGDVTNHEGVVIRDLASEDFKITGEFMVDDSGGFAQRPAAADPQAPVQKDEYLQEDEGLGFEDGNDVTIDLDVVDDETDDPVVDSDFPKTIAIVPGAFKPPHKGHLGMVRKYLAGHGMDVPKADNVIILVSNPTLSGRPIEGLPGGTIDPEQSIAIWQLLLEGMPGVIVKPSPHASPLTAAYDSIGEESEFPDGTKIILGASTKDDDWRRWERAEKYLKPGLSLVNPEQSAVTPDTHEPGYVRLLKKSGLYSSMPSVRKGKKPEEYHASDMRHLIELIIKDPKSIARKLMESFVGEGNVDALLSALMINAKLSEMNAMATGAVAGPVTKPTKRTKKKTKKENVDLRTVDEVMRLIMERGIMR